jgi:hypothetical protein
VSEYGDILEAYDGDINKGIKNQLEKILMDDY